VTRVVLPGDHGPRPTGWLGRETPFAFVTRVGSVDPITVYARAKAPPTTAGAGGSP